MVTISAHVKPEMQQHPEILRPFVPELTAFNSHNHLNILHPILRSVTYALPHPNCSSNEMHLFAFYRLLAQGLGLPEETFVKMHSFDGNLNKSYRKLIFILWTLEG